MVRGGVTTGPEGRRWNRHRILQRLIDDEAVAQEAVQLGIMVTDAEVEERFLERGARGGIVFGDAVTDDDVRDRIRRGLIQVAVQERHMSLPEPTLDEVRAFYASRGPPQETDRVRVEEVRFAIDADYNLAKGDATRFKTAWTRRTPLAGLLRRFPRASVVEQPQGGWRQAHLMDTFSRQALFSDRVRDGDVVGPAESGAAFVVYRLLERKRAHAMSFEEAEGQLRTQMRLAAQSRGTTALRRVIRENSAVECLDVEICTEPPRPPPGSPTSLDPHGAEEPASFLDPLSPDVRADIIAANRCTVDSDCALLGPVCPLGCNVMVHRAELAALTAGLARAPSPCRLACAAPPTPRCSAGHCVAAGPVTPSGRQP